MAGNIAVVLSILLVSGFSAVLCTDVLLFQITVHVTQYSNIPTTKQVGYLFDANSDGCTSLVPPPSIGNWFVILDDYSRCTLDKILHAREAGFKILFTSGDNRTITDAVRDADFPTVVILPGSATTLKSYAVTKQGTTYVTITTEDISGDNDQALRVTVLRDVENNCLQMGANICYYFLTFLLFLVMLF